MTLYKSDDLACKKTVTDSGNKIASRLRYRFNVPERKLNPIKSNTSNTPANKEMITTLEDVASNFKNEEADTALAKCV